MSHHRPNSLNSDSDVAVAALLSEFTSRLQRGERLQIDGFAAKHPEFASELNRLLPIAQAMAELAFHQCESNSLFALSPKSGE
jgi:hypothetical protein